MPSIDQRVKKLEKSVKTLTATVAKQKKAIAALEKYGKQLERRLLKMEKCCDLVKKWIKDPSKAPPEGMVYWSDEVTKMLRGVDWAALTSDYPGSGGTNPPQTPPDWPPA